MCALEDSAENKPEGGNRQGGLAEAISNHPLTENSCLPYFSFSPLLLAAITTGNLKDTEVLQYTHKHGFFPMSFSPQRPLS